MRSDPAVLKYLIGYQGEPVNITQLYRIRHASKARYAKDSVISDLQSEIRQNQEGITQ